MDLNTSGFRPVASQGQGQPQGQKGKKGPQKGQANQMHHINNTFESLQICSDQSGTRVIKGQDSQRSEQMNWRQNMGQYANTPNAKGQAPKGHVQGQMSGKGHGQHQRVEICNPGEPRKISKRRQVCEHV